jgi:hypothetical protein
MRVLSVFIICLFIALPSTLFSATLIQPVSAPYSAEIYKKLTSLKVSEVQKMLGRKLTFKEKVSFVILKHASARKAQSNKGSTALGFGIAGLAILLMGLFVPFLIWLALPVGILAIVLGNKAKRQDPSDKKAHTAVTLGWVTVGVFTLVLIAAVIILSSNDWY